MMDLNVALNVHLLRPWWLLALIPAIACCYWLYRQRNSNTHWSQVIDSELLDALLENGLPQKKPWPLWCLLAGWILAVLALSGPCFEKQTHTAMKQADAVVVLLDLSASMLVKDIAPSRLQAAHYKILDLLRQRKEGYTALIAYSGSAHVVAPLSDDANTVAALVTTLEPAIMPSLGSQAEDAVSEALQLLENSHFARGRILLISDGIIPPAAENINHQLKGKSVELHVIGVGSAQGGPVALGNSSFIKDTKGSVQTFTFDSTTLQQLAQSNHGHYSDLRSDDGDIAALIAPPSWLAQLSKDRTGKQDKRDASHTIEHWQDAGYWLIIPCLFIALMAFRRGVLVCLLPALMLAMPHRSEALNWQDLTWQDLWKTPDQQGAASLQQGDAATAATQFNHSEWKAFAEYQSNQHEQAAEHFAASDSAAAHYNRGNALARANKLDDAVTAYDEALKRQPDFSDAKANQSLVKTLLKQQDNKQQQDNKNQDNKNQEDQNDSKQDQQDGKQEAGQEGEKSQADSENDNTDNQKPDNGKSANGEPDEGKPGSKNPDDDKSQDKSAPEKQDEKNKADSGNSAAEKSAEAKKSAAEKQSDSQARASQEKQQAVEHMLRKVPDDPGGLLKNKFEYYDKLNRQQEARDRRSGNTSQEEQRW
jgi:Ca-activated chloride channel family protein